MRLSVIIPAYNEEARLPATLKQCHAWLREHLAGGFEILVVDDGSQDRTCDAVRKLMPAMPELRLLEQPENRGKGAAVRRGMLEASGDIRLFMDADHSTHIREVAKALDVFESRPEVAVVIASRQHPESDITQRQSWLRENMGKSFNALMRLTTGLDLRDTQCGFKVFRAEAAQAIFAAQRIDGFSFDVEILYLAGKLGYGIAEIPVEWINEPNSRVRMLLDPASMFLDLIRIRRLHRKD